jgi:hypothetical protein
VAGVCAGRVQRRKSRGLLGDASAVPPPPQKKERPRASLKRQHSESDGGAGENPPMPPTTDMSATEALRGGAIWEAAVASQRPPMEHGADQLRDQRSQGPRYWPLATVRPLGPGGGGWARLGALGVVQGAPDGRLVLES